MTRIATQRILVVDDEASLLMTLVANLELEGFEVAEAKMETGQDVYRLRRVSDQVVLPASFDPGDLRPETTSS